MRPLNDWLAQQLAQHPKEIELGLDRVRLVAQRLGLLPWKHPTVIVGGTNGKGSTVATLTALGRAAGLRTGTYTSPHLQRYNERIAIDGAPIDDAALCAVFERIEAVRTRAGEPVVSLTFFEWGTLAALAAFDAAQVELVVLEVGLGGRLDATNIVDADVAVLCSVSLDHTDWLGPTVEHIGAEKAGIFRAGRPVVLGSEDMPRSVHAALEALQCRAYWPNRDFRVRIDTDGSWQLVIDDPAAKSFSLGPLPRPALEGPVQRSNAAAALVAFAAIDRARLTTDVARSALANVRLRGRFQRVPAFPQGGPEWILDVAHNAAAAAALACALRDHAAGGRTIAIAGILGDKDATAIGEALADVVDEWVLAGLEGPRGCDAEGLRRRLPSRCRSSVLAADVAEACAAALAIAKPCDRIVVLGSFHTVGPALDWLGL